MNVSEEPAANIFQELYRFQIKDGESNFLQNTFISIILHGVIFQKTNLLGLVL